MNTLNICPNLNGIYFSFIQMRLTKTRFINKLKVLQYFWKFTKCSK